MQGALVRCSLTACYRAYLGTGSVMVTVALRNVAMCLSVYSGNRHA